MVVGYAVDGGRGDVYEALDTGLPGRSEHYPRALDLGGVDIGRLVERQRRRGVDDPLDAIHRPGDRLAVADVALQKFDPARLGIVEVGDVEHANIGLAPFEQVPHHVDPEKPAAARDQYCLAHESELPH